MKKLREKGIGVVFPLCEIVIGILLLVDPVGFTTGILMAMGILLILLGIVNIVGYFRSTPQAGILGKKLSKGILEVLGGLFCAVNPQWFVATFPALTIVYGIGILVSGVMKVEVTADMLRTGRKRWGWHAAGAALSLLSAGIILCNPFSATTALWIFAAVSLIVEAVVDFVAAFLPAKRENAGA